MFLVCFRYYFLLSLSYFIHDHSSYSVNLSCLNKRCCCCFASGEDPTLFRLTTSVLGRKNSSINSLYQSHITIKTHKRCIFCIDGLLSSDRGDSEAANGYGASGAITLQTKFLRRTVEPPRHLTSPKKSFGQSRFATGGFSGS